MCREGKCTYQNMPTQNIFSREKKKRPFLRESKLAKNPKQLKSIIKNSRTMKVGKGTSWPQKYRKASDEKISHKYGNIQERAQHTLQNKTQKTPVFQFIDLQEEMRLRQRGRHSEELDSITTSNYVRNADVLLQRSLSMCVLHPLYVDKKENV